MKEIILPDSNVIFIEDTHQYFYGNKELHGITSTIIRWAFPNTYAGVTQVVLDAAAIHGKGIHKAIEDYCKHGLVNEDCVELQAFRDMIAKHEMTVIANEYIVTDKKIFASAIDIVLMDKDGEIWLADLKCTSSLHKPKVSLQLSIYAYLFEKQTKLKVKGVVEIWLPKAQYGKPSYIVLNRASPTNTRKTINAYLDFDNPDQYIEYFTNQETPQLPANITKAMNAVASFEAQMKYISEERSKLIDFLLENMRSKGLDKIENENVRISYIAPSERKSISKDLLEKDYPDIYEKVLTTSQTKDSIRISLIKK